MGNLQYRGANNFCSKKWGNQLVFFFDILIWPKPGSICLSQVHNICKKINLRVHTNYKNKVHVHCTFAGQNVNTTIIERNTIPVQIFQTKKIPLVVIIFLIEILQHVIIIFSTGRSENIKPSTSKICTWKIFSRAKIDISCDIEIKTTRSNCRLKNTPLVVINFLIENFYTQ